MLHSRTSFTVSFSPWCIQHWTRGCTVSRLLHIRVELRSLTQQLPANNPHDPRPAAWSNEPPKAKPASWGMSAWSTSHVCWGPGTGEQICPRRMPHRTCKREAKLNETRFHKQSCPNVFATLHIIEQLGLSSYKWAHTHRCIIQGTQPGALWWPRGVGWGWVRRRLKREGIYIYTHTHTLMADLSHCMAETNIKL